MWLSQQINQEQAAPAVRLGEVTACEAEGVTVQAGREHRELLLLLPGGMDAPPALGQQAAVLPLETGAVCVGVVRSPGVAPGEVRLYSAGGASLWLKNDGTVVINGRVIDQNGEVR